MDQPLYDIFFTGQLVEGTDAETAKLNLAKLFKTTPEKLTQIFNGNPQVLKRAVDKAEALKYKAALHKAGLLVAFKANAATGTTPAKTPVAASVPAASSTAATSPTPAPSSPSQPEANDPQQAQDWSIAPAGSDVLKESERQHIPPTEIDTSAIKMVSAFANIEPEPEVVPPAPNTSHISVAAAGEDLLTEKPDAPPPLPLDIDDITLAPAGSDLEELQLDLPPVNPDISALSIAEAGADILEGQTKEEPPPAPNTDHLSFNKG